MLGFVTAAVFALVTPTAPGYAEPAAPCNFRLSPPHVVQLSGTDMVTATVDPAGCVVAAEPTLSVACVQMQGSQSAEQCA